MNWFKHIINQPFVAATGAAALVHSTWSLGTLFAGAQPEGWHLIGWLVPALLIAFALDVGQIATSAEIRAHGLTWSRGVTFLTFAVATYYLQWLYMAHHMPALELAAGVRQTWAATATTLRDAAIWIIPALLPLSTLLYTISSSKPTEQSATLSSAPVTVPPMDYDDAALLQPTTAHDALPPMVPVVMADAPNEPITYPASCDCGWSGEYASPAGAANALRAHKRHCVLTSGLPALEAHGNGNHNHHESE